MIRIRFLTDYRGRLTQERYYLAGAEASIDDAPAQELVKRKLAEVVTAAPAKRARKDKDDEE